MSVTVPVAYVEQFSANIHMLSEQRMSRLRSTVMVEGVTGESFSKERIGMTADAANEITELHGDTPLNNTPHTRRWGFPKDFDVADLIDKASRVKLLIDLDSSYTIRHAGVMGRSMDDEIIAALGGSATEGKNATTTTALPSGQKVASGSTGMTVDKLMKAKEILDANEVDEFYTRFCVVTSRQLRDLLNDDKVASNDFNTVKALVKGELDEYMGFKFVRSERLLKPSTERLCYVYAQPAVLLGIGAEPSSVANPRPDKRNATQIYTWGSWGAVRVEDEMVVEIAATEA